ncbi:MAG TPA: DUF445 domain-containing protein [Stellaceae bacterium]|nr:DUF445 domain-containing protein [Stellaceae bacterium]
MRRATAVARARARKGRDANDARVAAIIVIDTAEHQRVALRRNRLLATLLLLAAAAVFFATHLVRQPDFWILLLRAGSEAAVVGGLDDWFAVTALFRHPLGLPIPRTAIVPKSKDRIGEGLGDFVERNFLAPEIIAAKLREIEPARRVAEWLAVPDNARRVAEQLATVLPYAVRSLDDAEVRAFVLRSFGEQLREIDLAPVMGRVIALVTASGQYDVVFDRLLDGAQAMVAANEERIYAMVAERSRWWIPKQIDQRIARAVLESIAELLGELRLPGSGAREELRRAVAALADDLVASPEQRRRFNEAKDRLLDQPEVQGWLARIWDDLRRIVVDDLASPVSRTREAVYTGILSFGRALAADRPMQARLEAAFEQVALAAVPWRGQIGALIADVVRSWDARTVSERLELAIGSDLQYIRMTGTLVGACVGCALYLVSYYLF